MHSISLESNTLRLTGKVTRENAAAFLKEAYHALKDSRPQKLDLSGLEALDSAGVASLEELIQALYDKVKLLEIVAPPPQVEMIMTTFRDVESPVSKPVSPGVFESVGDSVVQSLSALKDAFVLCSELAWWSLAGLFDRKGQRKGSFTAQGVLLGYNALPVVALLSFIIGFILSLQSAAQLKIYGGNVFLPDLLAVTLVREMGPLITAIIVAGRSGSAIASEIATMQVSEEIDALRMMAINPLRYVVVPKFHAITVVMPLLVVFSIIVGEIGGLLIGMGMLDLSLSTFLTRSIEIITIKDVVISLTKSTVFAWLIVIIGAYYGFRVKGGAEGVGKATTASVVASIFAVVIADAVFSLFYLV